MALNFNVDPYYDDFDETKNFHRILFKPGYAVQARELTQSQTILQDQITKFADNIFKQNSPVTGGQITTNFDCYYIKLQETFNDSSIDVNQFDGLLVQNATGTVIAQVLAVAAATTGEPDTIVVSYKTGSHFQDDDIIYDVNSNLAARAITSNSSGLSSVVSISQGVFYILGNFVQIQADTIILDKYDNTPSKRVGLTITETIYDYINDPSILDPAVGASNYQAPGADRYVISLSLDTRPIQFGDDDDFVELVRVVDGSVTKLVSGSVYNVIDDYFAKRDYETNGDYVIEDFKLTPKANTVDYSTYDLSIGKGLAYVRGYRLENASSVTLTSNRARTTASQSNRPVYIDYGSYFYVDTLRGSSSFFDVTTGQQVDLHCVTTSGVRTTNTATYSSTLIGTGFIRNLNYDFNTNVADANSYVYKAYVNDIELYSPSANAITGTSNTITFPGTYSLTNNAYVGVTIFISNGTSAGDTRTITSYNGTTRVATVDQNWTLTPDTTSVFVFNFGIKDTETLVAANKTSFPATIVAHSRINATGRTGALSTGNALLFNDDSPEMIFKIGNPYVATISDASYYSQQLNRGVVFTAGATTATATINFSGSYAGVIEHLGTAGSTLSSDTVRENFVIVVTNAGVSSLTVGQLLPFSYLSGTVSLSGDSRTATLSIPLSSVGSGFTADILEKVYISNADNTSYALKYKNLITANTQTVNISGTTVNTYTKVDDNALTSTGQIYIQKAGLVSPGNKQSLYLSDVKRIVKIIDTKDSGTTPTVAMLTNAANDITKNYNFNNGQKDSYYDHASITLKPGAPQPVGNILILVDYYQHTGGDGYFSITSYLNSTRPDTYQNIPLYISRDGIEYQLRDCIDFRPVRTNASTSFEFKYNNTGDGRQGIFIPTDLSTFVSDYSYYLGRSDKLILSKDKNFEIIEGSPALSPFSPNEPDGSLVIANLLHKPYTGYIPTEAPTGTIPDLSIEKVKHKRYTMKDISGLEERINNLQYYTSLNLLEQKTKNLQISDSLGLSRFKNGILVDDFSSYATADTANPDYNAAINRRLRYMSPTYSVKNYPLKSLATVYSLGQTTGSLGYSINKDGDNNFFALPYTTANVITQKFASRFVNVNPFSVSIRDGVVSLTPNMDNWVDTEYAPALLIIDPDLQIFSANSQAINVLSAGDWTAVPGTTTSSSAITASGRNWNQTTTTTTWKETKTDILGAYDKLNNTYELNNQYIQDISILPYIRPQQVVTRAKGMLLNTSVNCYFDGSNVNNYFRKPNIIELTSVTGTFNENDVVGYYASGAFTPTARVLGVYKKTNGNVRLYVAADGFSSSYIGAGTILQSALFNSSGAYVSSPASGSVSSTNHFGGQITNAANTTTISLSQLASSVNNYYNGNTIYFNSGTGQGFSANITSYQGSTKTATISPAVTTANGDIYSIGSFSTDETGSLYGVFNIPPNTFHTGQRTLRIDNRVNNNIGTETTFAEGTYYAEGLAVKAQSVDFGASPAGAKNTFYDTDTRTNVSVTNFFTSWDPVAQTFIVGKDNFPNGMFLNSITVFFKKKPTSDSTPISLSIVSTLNGYPSGQTLDGSVVTLLPSQINVSETPQYLDGSAATKFTFSNPVYIQPGVLYAFILKSLSNQYELWTASNGDTALSSSVKNLPTDVTPSSITKIGTAPYVGGLFISQNAQTWTVDQNQSLMFVADRCVFTTSTSPTIQFVVPNKLPQRTLVEQSLQYYFNANSVFSSIDSVSYSDQLIDALNLSTTDFLPTNSSLNYSYNASLLSGSAAGSVNINPGKYGTPTSDHIHLNDGRGQRVLIANSNSSFSLYAQLTSIDDAVSPILSDAGLSVYTMKYNINNAPCTNTMITLNSGGSGYNVNTTTITVSAPTGTSGTQAYAAANIENGVIQSIYFTTPGSGYITTPSLTIADSNSAPGTGASVTVSGETSVRGGNASAKYITKKVILATGFDSDDLVVYLSAYRPVNTDINVYYKVLNKNDTQNFDDGKWQLMTKTGGTDAMFSITRDDIREYVFSPGTEGIAQGYITYTSTNGQIYNSFNQFAIKIVMTTSDSTFSPFAIDMRAIALPADN